VCELPPNGQGLAALIALNILECFDLADAAPTSAPICRSRRLKLAYADRGRWIADPEHANVPVYALLDKAYAQGRAALIRPDAASKRVAAGSLPASDTVYLTTADRDGMIVSLINSLYLAFGSGMVAGDTASRCRTAAPASRSTLRTRTASRRATPVPHDHSRMLLRDGRPLASFGVMGGDMQARDTCS
jgi:gamma-glutamyltranspeptidase/glutathione hydrolase